MKKDVQEAIQFAMNNTLLLVDKINELVDKVAELEDNLAFYGSSINILEMTVKKLSNDFHGTQQINPYTVRVSGEQSEALQQALEELTPKNVADGLNRLYTKADGGRTYLDDVNDKVDKIILEKKIRERIVARLEKEADEDACNCGDICNSFNNGFSEAINRIRTM